MNERNFYNGGMPNPMPGMYNPNSYGFMDPNQTVQGQGITYGELNHMVNQNAMFDDFDEIEFGRAEEDELPIAKGSNTETEEDDDDKISIKVEEHLEFPGTITGYLAPTTKVSKIINDLFYPLFLDYDGSFLEFTNNPMNPFKLKIYFVWKKVHDGEGGLRKAVKLITEDNNGSPNDVVGQVRSITSKRTNSYCEFTNLAKKALAPFVSRQFKKVVHNKKTKKNELVINWKAITFEKITRTNTNGFNIHYCVELDISKVLAAIYGATEDGDRCDYAISMNRPLLTYKEMIENQHNGGANNMRYSEYLVTVNKLNNRLLKEAAKECGFGETYDNDGIQIVRDRS